MRPSVSTIEIARQWDAFVEKVVREIAIEQEEFARGLGKIDLDLRKQDKALPLIPDIAGGANPHHHAHAHSILITSAVLWTFGAYELVRVLDKRLNPNTSRACPFPEAKNLKRFFESVRIPLAKLEKAERAVAAGDTGFAIPQRSASSGCEWCLGSRTISRSELADQLLNFRPDLTRFPAR